jgi:hypothetical protein
MKHISSLYLWKEWREQRATLGWLALALFLLAGGGMFLAPRAMVTPDPTLVFLSMALCFLAAMLTVGADLLPGEVVRGKVRFLGRLPSGLGAAFRAKFLLLAAISVAAVFYGALLVIVLFTLRTGAVPERALLGGESWIPCAFLFFLGVAMWTFAVSAWVPRSTLALPATAILLSLICWPIVLIVVGGDWYRPREWEIPDHTLAYFVLCLVAAPFVAWVSFVRGMRFGRGSRQAAWRGLAVALLFVSPAFGSTAHRYYLYCTIDPTSEDFRIVSCLVSEGGEYAYVRARRGEDRFEYTPGHALVVDLATGEWRSEGIGYWTSCMQRAHNFGARAGGRVSHVWFSTWFTPIKEEERRYFDARTSLPATPPPGPADCCGFSIPEEVVPLDEISKVDGIVGLGLRVVIKGEGDELPVGIYDPFRKRLFFAEDVPEGVDFDGFHTFVRPGHWICRDRDDDSLALVDPETGERSPVLGFDAYMLTPCLADDGRLLDLDGRSLQLVDPETGVTEEWPLPATVPGDVSWVYRDSGDPGCLRAIAEGRFTYLRFDSTGQVLRHALPVHARSGDRPRLVGCPDEDTAIVYNSQRIERIYFDGRDPEVVFPRIGP